MQKREIVQRFLEAGLLVHPGVVNYISECAKPGVIETIINTLPHGISVVTPKEVAGMATFHTDKLDVGLSPIPLIEEGREGTSSPLNNPEDAYQLMRSRFEQISRILRDRITPYPIEALVRQGSKYADMEVGVVGIVVSAQTNKNGHRVVELEDTTGTIRVLFNKNREGFSEAEKIIPDEIIGVKGTLSKPSPGTNFSTMLFGDKLIRPDIPLTHTFEPPKGVELGKIALISDVHVGSDTFLPDAWDRFNEWLFNHPEIGYLLIDGDVVDGIGVYPDQDKELHIKTIFEQYDYVGELLSELPKHLQIVLAPGNHDAVRGAEPQPALPLEFRTKFPKNVTFVENPSVVNINSVKIMMYHGRSIDDLIKYIPGASYNHPGEIMEAMLQRRHLCPIYGQRTPLLSTEKDRLVISEVPDILHTGHVHISEVINYHGVLGINAGTWQSQTSFQKQMNINPTPAQAAIVDLSTLSCQMMGFLDSKGELL